MSNTRMIKIKPYISNKHCDIKSKRLSIWSGLESRSSWIRWKLPLPLRKIIWRSQSESVKSLSYVRFFVPWTTPWTVACQDPPSMRFSRQENWSGLPFSSLWKFLTQGSSPDLLHCRHILYHLNQQGIPWRGEEAIKRVVLERRVQEIWLFDYFELACVLK